MSKTKIITLLFLFVSTILSAQVDYRVLSRGSDTLLNSYLLKMADQEYEQRATRLKKALTSKKELRKYQKKIRFAQKIYDENPGAEITGTIPCKDYQIEKLIIQNISANLYIPHKEGKKPAVLFLCGHEKQGKAAESYQRTAALLAQHGFVVLVPDPISQGEMLQYLDSVGNPLVKRATTEHTLLNQSNLLAGHSVAAAQFVLNEWALNYLINRPEVDAQRIGAAGNSGGATQLTYLASMDKRIKAVASCSYFTKRRRMLHGIGPDDGCQYTAGEIANQYEIVDYYIKQAPRPTLILAGTEDFIDYQGVEEAFSELKQVYTLLGKPNNAQLFVVNDGHGITKPKREETVRFFKTVFMNDSSAITESDITVLPEKSLWASKTGQLFSRLESTQDLAERQNLIAIPFNIACSNQEKLEKEELRGEIYELLGLFEEQPALSIEETKTIELENATLKKWILRRDCNVEVPALVFIPKEIKPQSEVYIILNDDGMNAALQTGKVNELLAKGSVVLLADPRGIGETKDDIAKNNPKFYSEDYRNAALSVLLGMPLMGQRVVDVFSMIDALETLPIQGKKIVCLTEGNIGVAALHARFLDGRIAEVQTNNCIESWEEMFTDPMAKNRMSLVVPKALLYYDIPDLRK